MEALTDREIKFIFAAELGCRSGITKPFSQFIVWALAGRLTSTFDVVLKDMQIVFLYGDVLAVAECSDLRTNSLGRKVNRICNVQTLFCWLK